MPLHGSTHTNYDRGMAQDAQVDLAVRTAKGTVSPARDLALNIYACHTSETSRTHAPAVENTNEYKYRTLVREARQKSFV